jgi:hypothetical protein
MRFFKMQRAALRSFDLSLAHRKVQYKIFVELHALNGLNRPKWPIISKAYGKVAIDALGQKVFCCPSGVGWSALPASIGSAGFASGSRAISLKVARMSDEKVETLKQFASRAGISERQVRHLV